MHFVFKFEILSGGNLFVKLELSVLHLRDLLDNKRLKVNTVSNFRIDVSLDETECVLHVHNARVKTQTLAQNRVALLPIG